MAMTTEREAGAALYRLLAWLSPAYPVGAFSYSHGLEQAVEAGLVHDASSTREWLRDVLCHGGARNDGVFLACAHGAIRNRDREALRETAELAAAMAPSVELALETTAQGAAFVRITQDVWPCAGLHWLTVDWPGPYAYPVAVGAAASGHRLDLDRTLIAYLHAVAANLVSAAVRLIPLGQSDGQRVTAELTPTVLQAAAGLRNASLDDAGSATALNDICSMLHESQYTRLFRS